MEQILVLNECIFVSKPNEMAGFVGRNWQTLAVPDVSTKYVTLLWVDRPITQ